MNQLLEYIEKAFYDLDEDTEFWKESYVKCYTKHSTICKS